MAFELVAVPILPLFLVTRHLEFHCSHCPSRKYLHSKCAPAVGRGLRTEQPTGTRDSVHTARDLREVCFCRYERRVSFMAMFFQRLWQWLLFLWRTLLFVQRISTAQSHNPHAQKFLLCVAKHICICCLCHCSGAHYYRIAF